MITKIIENINELSLTNDLTFSLSLLLYFLLIFSTIFELFRLRFIAYDPLHSFLLPSLYLLPLSSLFVGVGRRIIEKGIITTMGMDDPTNTYPHLAKYLSFYLPQFCNFLCVSSLLHCWIKIYITIRRKEKRIEKVSRGIYYSMIILIISMTMRGSMTDLYYSSSLLIAVALQTVYILCFAIHHLIQEIVLSKQKEHEIIHQSTSEYIGLLSSTKRSLFLSLFYLLFQSFFIYSSFISPSNPISAFLFNNGNDMIEMMIEMMMEMMMVMVYMYTVRAYREYGNLIFPSNPKDLTPSWLSSVLHKNGMLPSSIIIKSFKGEKLDGGYHSKVRKFEVEYSSLPPFSPSPLSSSSSSPSPSLNGIYYNNINNTNSNNKKNIKKIDNNNNKKKSNNNNSKGSNNIINNNNNNNNNKEEEEKMKKELPKTYVVKILSWKTSVWERMVISMRMIGGKYLANRETLYLESYQNETRFYTQIAPLVQGIKIPKVYYNFEDCFNNKFGFVLQDAQFSCDPLPPLSPLPINNNNNNYKKKNGERGLEEHNNNNNNHHHQEGHIQTNHQSIDGQPNGFTESQTINLMIQLARFHSPFWDQPKYLNKYKTMENGGYWTGEKLMIEKRNIAADWMTAVDNYSPHLSISPSARQHLGRRLSDNLDLIQSQCSLMSPLTFLHGDYKISNLFLNPNESELFHLSLVKGVYAIDWQWIGKGAGVNDVAYYLCTSTTPDCFSISFFKKIVRIYTGTLEHLGILYPFDVAWVHFKLAVIDFFLFSVVSKYSKMKVEEIYHYQEKRKDGLHLRSLFHIERFIEITETFMNDLNYN